MSYSHFSEIFSLAATLLLLALIGSTSIGAEPPRDYRKQAPLFEDLGDHHFPISSQVALAQRYFDQGIVLAYGFNHAEAARSFREVQRLDPSCAMGYWGEALVLGPNINAPMQEKDTPRAWQALERARAATATDRERAYVDALATRYRPEVVEDRATLDQAFADAMREVANQYPDDYDAQSLFAEALMDTTPWDYWQPDGRPKEVTVEILQTLERVLARAPNHPLANHLYIHAVEAAHPAWGVASADRLGPLAPSASHLVHMPSHIYIRVGRYADASRANELAILADDKYVTECHAQGLYPLAYMPHNRHFLWFSATMEGRSKLSIQAAQNVGREVDRQKMREPGFGALQHFYSMPWYALVRFGQWQELLRAPPPADDLKYPRGVWHFTRGLALLRTGDSVGAGKQLAQLQQLAADETLDDVMIWETNSTRHLLQIATHVLCGEMASSGGNHAAAIQQLRDAVASEDRLIYEEPPSWYAPARQTLGAVLLEAERFADAEAAFREDLKKYPANGWSLLGLQRALAGQGEHAEATATAAAFRRAWQRADIELPGPRF